MALRARLTQVRMLAALLSGAEFVDPGTIGRTVAGGLADEVEVAVVLEVLLEPPQPASSRTTMTAPMPRAQRPNPRMRRSRGPTALSSQPNSFSSSPQDPMRDPIHAG
jgi:hypothetical protein